MSGLLRAVQTQRCEEARGWSSYQNLENVKTVVRGCSQKGAVLFNRLGRSWGLYIPISVFSSLFFFFFQYISKILWERNSLIQSIKLTPNEMGGGGVGKGEEVIQRSKQKYATQSTPLLLNIYSCSLSRGQICVTVTKHRLGCLSLPKPNWWDWCF